MSDRSDAITGVQATITTYAQALDTGRTEDIVELFTPDAEVQIIGKGTFIGHDAIRETYSAWKPTGPQRHITANILVTPTADDRATAVGDLVYLERGESGWTVELVGRYEDSLRQSDGKWLFEKRILSFE